MKALNIFFLSLLLFTQYASAGLPGQNFIPQNPYDLNPPVIIYTPLFNTNSTAGRTLTALITDIDGVPVSGIGLPVLYWKINSGSWQSAIGSFVSGNDYQFTFGSGVVVADVVYYYIVAQDMASTPNVGAFPSGGAGGFSPDPPAAATPPAFPSNYTVTYFPLSGDYTVGTAAFNKITGKHIYFEKTVKKVIKNVDVQEPDKLNGGLIKLKQKLMEVEEVEWIPMENRKKYYGKLYVLKSEHPEYNFPMNVNGVYATLSLAVDELNFRGISGATRFLLVDASYTTGETYPIVINIANDNLPTSSNTVTIKPTGVNTTITSDAGVGPVLRILSDYITIDGSYTINGTTRDLTITNNSPSGSQAIQFISRGTTPVTGSVVKNCILINKDNTTSALIVTNFSVLGGYFSNITIQNNSFQNAWYGIYCRGVTGNASGLNIIGNDLNSSTNPIRQYGIYVDGFDGVDVSGNDIANFDGTTDEIDDGIWIGAGTKNSVIEKNKIYNLGYTGVNGYGAQAIKVQTGVTSANISVINNAIYNIYGSGFDYTTNLDNNPMGIYLLSMQSGINVYNNSIYLYGNTLIQNLAMSIGICIGTGTAADIRNNNIVNNLGLGGLYSYGACAIYAQTDNTQFTDINFNNYYVNPSGTGVKAIGKLSTTTTATVITDWSAATGKDQFSVSADPGFTSSTNLQPDVNNVNCWNINAGGLPLSIVTADINNNSRSTSVINGAGDIGAYEFTPVVSAGNLTVSGSIIDSGTTNIIFAGITLASITWHANGGTLPTSVTAVFQPGVNPSNVISGSQFANENFAISVLGGSGYLYNIFYKYNLARQGTIVSESLYRIAEYSGSAWTQYPSIPNTNTKTITDTNLNTFATYTFSDGSAPLPVQISSFTSNVISRDVKLNWTTASELNNAGFEILRSAQNDNWVKVGYVNGNGTKTTPTNYSFEDKNLNTGKYKYRLKQIDYNGNFEYHNLSNIVEIGVPNKYDISQNYPNPFNPTAKIDFELPFDSRVSIKLYDMNGREMLTLANEQRSAGYYMVQMNGNNLSSGTYFYRIIAEGNGQKFVMTKKAMLIK
ncbi:MAG TPA: T9SS type A sorting domain-containing protein [Ignavibacteria bacterium]